MCFSPKVKMPKTTVTTTPIDPAPISDEVAGVQFGDSSDDDSKSTDDFAIEKDKTTDDSTDKDDSLSNKATSSADITASTIGKSIKRKSVFGGK
ncbi:MULTISPECIES: putative phage head protein [Klebsiella/Raoultella group]|nr:MULTISPECIES: putative phage head protein [Klebsiella/Raoultella group]MCC4942726.1 DUF5476 domain-containing protein [Klebsiella pneumoniae]MCC4947284.1 DUF5476 domain-containing protein [Klebsiella pneumoniae]MCC4966126.1 DUF5476 domain-containing protein [Klebsiella pneumoniae]MCC4973840.1 DUF5476 domain-containing protein [Klebsiella pneumoniae]MCC4987860.1 DUF5476 domain-containing protein [Klebsiella pneumoniae]